MHQHFHPEQKYTLAEINQNIVSRLRANNESIIQQVRELTSIFTDNLELIKTVETALSTYEDNINDLNRRLDLTVEEQHRLEELLNVQQNRYDEDTRELRARITALTGEVEKDIAENEIIEHTSVQDVISLENGLTDEQKVSLAEQYTEYSEETKK